MLSVVVLNWKRKENLEPIVAELSRAAEVSEILIWNNNPEVCLTSGEPKVTVINSSRNFICHSRYAAALLAANGTILFQDDDLILPAETVSALYARGCAEPDRIHGLFGRRLHRGHYARFVEGRDAEVPILAGRCLLFKRELALEYFKLVNHPALLEIKRSTGVDLDDVVFSCAATMATNRYHRTWNLPFRELPAPDSLCEKKLHFKARDMAVQALRKLLMEQASPSRTK